MAGTYAVYYRNHDGSDSTHNDSYTSSSPCPTIDTFGWSAPSGKSFKEWNTSRDGSGTSMFPGETYTQIEGNRYAIWEDAPVPYLTDDKEIKSIADAIRTKGGTSSALVYPDGFVTAIGNISTGTDVSDTTAAASDVLSGKYFYTSSGTKTQGSIATKTSSNLSASGKTVTVPAGYYASQYTKDVATGSATTPATTATVTPSISLNGSTGVVTASVSGSKSVTPTVSAGYVSSGTAGTVTISGSNTYTIPAWSGGSYGGATTISFTITANTYTANSGMTWEQWVMSAYNTGGYSINGNNYVVTSQNRTLKISGTPTLVLKTDTIIENGSYTDAGK